MQAELIFQPFFALLVLTVGVWVTMYVRRTSFLLSNRIDLRKVDTPAKVDAGIPSDVNLPAYALKNLFELPLVFYALCLYLFATDSVDQIYLVLAWVFVAGRIVHSVIYCTYNKVLHRFAAYFTSALVLWGAVVRAAIGAVGISDPG